MINFDDFKKLEIKIGTIKEAEVVPETDKLLKLTVDLSEDEDRIIVAGIADSYQAEDVVGRQIPILANLEPRTIKGIESQGMILAIDVDGQAVLFRPDKEVGNGSQVR